MNVEKAKLIKNALKQSKSSWSDFFLNTVLIGEVICFIYVLGLF